MRGSSVNGVSVNLGPRRHLSVARQLDRLELGTVDEGVADAFAEVAAARPDDAASLRRRARGRTSAPGCLEIRRAPETHVMLAGEEIDPDILLAVRARTNVEIDPVGVAAAALSLASLSASRLKAYSRRSGCSMFLRWSLSNQCDLAALSGRLSVSSARDAATTTIAPAKNAIGTIASPSCARLPMLRPLSLRG